MSQEKPAAFEVPIDFICDISVTDSYEIPIRYIEEDDWEDLPTKQHPPERFRDIANGE